ncbi:MAG: hypothetical protein EPO68_11390 [Planctomycetota bacterium]|nr:MAG: hypothetical protein EPO68_11390 [Planctomycetota bacterium]
MATSTVGSVRWVLAGAIWVGVLGGLVLRQWVDAREARAVSTESAPPDAAHSLAIRARLRGPDGPLAPRSDIRLWRRPLANSVGLGDESNDPEIHPLGEHGELVLAHSTSEHVDALRIVVQTRAEPALEAHFDVVAPHAIDAFDAGELELRPVRILVAGLVVQASGEPAAFAHVELESQVTDAPLAQLDRPELDAERATHDEMRAAILAARDSLQWSSGASRATYSNGSGLFAFFSADPIARVRVRAAASDADASEWVELGGAEPMSCRIELPEVAPLSGRVLLAPDVPLDDLSVGIEDLHRHRYPLGVHRYAKLAGDGSWSLTSVRVGAPRVLWLRALNTSLEIAVSEPFAVEAGGRSVPDFDLRDLRALDCELVDERGAPLDGAHAAFRWAAGQPWEFAFQHDGRTRLWVRGETVEAWLMAPGRACRHVAKFASGQRFELEPETPETLARELRDFPRDLIERIRGPR